MQQSQWENNKNTSELFAYSNLEAWGFTVYRRGWPDCVAVRGSEVRFIEVKPGREPLRQRQRDMAAVFSIVGLEYEIWHVRPDTFGSPKIYINEVSR